MFPEQFQSVNSVEFLVWSSVYNQNEQSEKSKKFEVPNSYNALPKHGNPICNSLFPLSH